MSFRLGLSYRSDNEADSRFGTELASAIVGQGGSVMIIDCDMAVGRYSNFKDISRENNIDCLAIIWSHASQALARFHTLARLASQENALWLVEVESTVPLPNLPPITKQADPPRFSFSDLTVDLTSPQFIKILEEYAKNGFVKRPNPLSETRTKEGYRTLKSDQKVSIFISHAGIDKDRISPIVSVLIRCGFSLWVDRPHELQNLPPEYIGKINGLEMGEDWSNQIDQALEGLDVVLGMWSKNADDDSREKYHRELFNGLILNKLYIGCLDDHPLRPPYGMIQCAKLSSLKDEVHNAALDRLIEDISGKLRFNKSRLTV